MGDHGITCSMSRSGNVWDNAAMESFFSSLKTERTARKVYRTRNDARADVLDYIERFYNPKRRHSTLGYLSPNDLETKVGLLNLESEKRQQARTIFRKCLRSLAHASRKPWEITSMTSRTVISGTRL